MEDISLMIMNVCVHFWGGEICNARENKGSNAKNVLSSDE